MAKYFIDIEAKLKNLAIYQEAIRSEIRNSIPETNQHVKFAHEDSEEDPLSLIKENTFEEVENFLAETINENKKEIKTKTQYQNLLLQKLPSE